MYSGRVLLGGDLEESPGDAGETWAWERPWVFHRMSWRRRLGPGNSETVARCGQTLNKASENEWIDGCSHLLLYYFKKMLLVQYLYLLITMLYCNYESAPEINSILTKIVHLLQSHQLKTVQEFSCSVTRAAEGKAALSFSAANEDEKAGSC